MPEQRIDRGSLARITREVAVLHIARDQPRALERSADALGDDLDPVLQLAGARCRHRNEPQARASLRVDAVEKLHMEVNIEIQCAAEALDQRHGTGLRARARESCSPYYMPRDRPIDDPAHLRQNLRSRREQKPQRERQR